MRCRACRGRARGRRRVRSRAARRSPRDEAYRDGRGRGRGRRPGRQRRRARRVAPLSPEQVARLRDPARSRSASCPPTEPTRVERAAATARSRRSASSCCRGSPGRSRWTRCPRRRWSPATARALVAAERLPRFFPLFMTAAGTVPPAKVLCSAPASPGCRRSPRRAGSARSSRRTTCAPPRPTRCARWARTFVELDLEALEGAGGYAREMTEDRAGPPARAARAARRRSRRRDHHRGDPGPHGAAAGHRARWSRRCGPGSVVVDLAAETGGNCELSVAGEESTIDGVLVWGARDVAVVDARPRQPALRAQRQPTCCC